MSRLTGLRRWRNVAAWRLVAAVVVIEAVAVVSIYGYEWLTLRAKQNRTAFNAKPAGSSWWKFEAEGILRPPALKAEEAGLAENEEVIGVEAGGKARAYRLGAFLDPPSHVVNDLLEEVPVSVVYCDIADCTRVYAGPKGAGPLDVSQAGLLDGEMILKIGGVMVRHQSDTPLDPGAGPPATRYEVLPTTRTTWHEWKRRHPETDVYVGRRN